MSHHRASQTRHATPPTITRAIHARLKKFGENGDGARTMQKLQSYDGEPVYDNNAYTLSAVYHKDILTFYCHYSIKRAESLPEYYMHRLVAYPMLESKSRHLQGLNALMNAEDWTKKIRAGFIKRANDHVEKDGTSSEVMSENEEEVGHRKKAESSKCIACIM